MILVSEFSRISCVNPVLLIGGNVLIKH